MIISLLLSHIIGIGLSYNTCIFCKVYFIHKRWVQQEVATIYSALVVEREIEAFFLLKNGTRHSPRTKEPPLILFRSSTSPSQSTSVKIVNEKSSPLGYQSPYSIMVQRYRRILLVSSRKWLHLGVAWVFQLLSTSCMMFGIDVFKYKMLPIIDLYKFLSTSGDSTFLLSFHPVTIGVLTKEKSSMPNFFKTSLR